MSAAATISDFMTRSPHTISATASMAAARELMDRHGIRHLPVLEGGKLVGIVTDRDLTLVSNLRDDPKTVSVEEAMTPEPFTVAPNASLAEVALTMAVRKLGAAVVLERDKVAGVFTTIDALRALAGK